MADFDASKVQLYKLDKVDKTPMAAIHLGPMVSSEEAETMGAASSREVCLSRVLTVFVDFHRDTSGGDADAELDAWLVELETAVYQAMVDGDFNGKADFISLERAEFHPTPTGKERKGDLVTEWRVQFAESVALSLPGIGEAEIGADFEVA